MSTIVNAFREADLKAVINKIKPADDRAVELATKRQDALVKPPGSLGKLEEASIKLAGITGKVNNEIKKARIVVMCADNGVCEEGIGSAPISVTAAQAVNMNKAITGMSSIAKAFGSEIRVVDVGIATPYECDDVIKRVVRKGTRNLAKEPALTRAEVIKAISVGLEMAKKAKQEGVDVLGTGEMGIGNTTTSSAILSVLTGLSVEEVTGRGGGITDSNFLKKKQIIEQAIAMHKPNPDDVLDVMAKVGGLDIAGMCGVFLGAARERIPVVIDGFISVVSALCAYRLCPAVRDYLFPSHASYEIGYSAAIKELGLAPYFALDMRLGEGSGCPLTFAVLHAACAVMNGMETFAGAEINDDYLEEIREKDSYT
ncbi:MAG: nicotinate-nucleotide--dimethylbenzimidazole phosphoribosyltransferase, partial [Lachnospiraceae bacterium]|nr:nicotinate-nucleotide--dimethylbenzimidazole phosphoribosyltransferase [Candidatus Equihabitans merdae]